MNVAVVGTGYVGLVTGTCFAETGNQVVCVDIDEAKVRAMQAGKVPIYEPGLEELFHRNIEAKRLTFTSDLAAAVPASDVIFLALPTPPNEDGSADLSYILGVAKQLGPLLKQYAVIVNKSTVPVGTAEQVRAAVGKGASVEFDVVSNPEFLREGLAIQDFMQPDRVVLGVSSDKAEGVMRELYDPFLDEDRPLYAMDERSAEMTKYAANAFLATKVSFINEIANLSELAGANVDNVRLGIGADDRIGRRFLQPGIGYGGSCFPKDVKALYKTAADHDYDFKILKAVTAVNDNQPRLFFERIKQHYKGDLKGKHFAFWGLAFKPDTDDIREAASGHIISDLLDAGARITAYDPEANEVASKKYQGQAGIDFADNMMAALDGADALIITTEWPVFRSPDFVAMKQKLAQPVVFDGRNIYETELMQQQGFTYKSIGRLDVTTS
ncbi:MAG TPA: UDP-glucose/GDP-mannose dehydrogenase family protein [Candidatus Saccharimonadales bacterium]